MIEVDITEDMKTIAHTKARNMGAIKNSITKGAGNSYGFLGELIAQQVMGGELKNTRDYDLVLDSGKLIDVKTKRTSVTPQPHYECSVAAFNTKQKCDDYAFVRVKNDQTVGWFLGTMPKNEYMERAVFLKKGQHDPSNNFYVKADCHNMMISDLNKVN